jgi:hypothetical protein
MKTRVNVNARKTLLEIIVLSVKSDFMAFPIAIHVSAQMVVSVMRQLASVFVHQTFKEENVTDVCPDFGDSIVSKGAFHVAAIRLLQRG